MAASTSQAFQARNNADFFPVAPSPEEKRCLVAGLTGTFPFAGAARVDQACVIQLGRDRVQGQRGGIAAFSSEVLYTFTLSKRVEGLGWDCGTRLGPGSLHCFVLCPWLCPL